MFPCLKRSCSVNVLADCQALLGPGKACSSLTTYKQTDIQLLNHRNRNQHRNLHRNAKNGRNPTSSSGNVNTSGSYQ